MKRTKEAEVRPVATPARAPNPDGSAGPYDETIPAYLDVTCHHNFMVSCLVSLPEISMTQIDLLAEDSQQTPTGSCTSEET